MGDGGQDESEGVRLPGQTRYCVIDVLAWYFGSGSSSATAASAAFAVSISSTLAALGSCMYSLEVVPSPADASGDGGQGVQRGALEAEVGLAEEHAPGEGEDAVLHVHGVVASVELGEHPLLLRAHPLLEGLDRAGRYRLVHPRAVVVAPRARAAQLRRDVRAQLDAAAALPELEPAAPVVGGPAMPRYMRASSFACTSPSPSESIASKTSSSSTGRRSSSPARHCQRLPGRWNL